MVPYHCPINKQVWADWVRELLSGLCLYAIIN